MPVATRSSLELILDSIQQMENQPRDVPPALPIRPVSRARLPPGRRSLLPTNSFQRLDSKDEHTEREDIRKEVCMFNSNRTKKETFLRPEFVSISSSCGDFGPEDNRAGVQKQLCAIGDATQRAIQGAIGIQKCIRGHQARCRYHEIKTGIIALQSSIRGWLSRRSFNQVEEVNKISIENKEGMRIMDYKYPSIKDHVQVPNFDLVNLERRILKAEAALGNKEEENATLRQQLEQYEERCQQYEAKMKFMENMWQDQLTSIQVNLVEANLKAKDTDRKDENLIGMSPEDELRKLKLGFGAWEREYKAQVRETKAILHKLGHSHKRNFKSVAKELLVTKFGARHTWFLKLATKCHSRLVHVEGDEGEERSPDQRANDGQGSGGVAQWWRRGRRAGGGLSQGGAHGGGGDEGCASDLLHFHCWRRETAKRSRELFE
ncbi:hypothetical protein RJ639_025146 [Escallonia herrerae]|uniref:Uncharacterized protein n=1 Tax=Escallonia herrerae TaxID=1293975 RepID=A0AA88S344_9ASTE|nr:hypothetical protein RJ639_025146 [Escallonia herrerae]